jgi:hypothetical protein
MAVEILEVSVKVKESEGTKFYYIEVEDSRSAHRIWINPSYHKKELEKLERKYFNSVFRNSRVEKTSKGNLVIKQGSNNVFLVRVRCGYRGSSEFEVLSNVLSVHKFDFKHSPNGALGISEVGLIETPEDFVKIQWRRSGRLYGEPSKGISVIKIDGSIESINDIVEEEIDEIIAE